MTASYITANTKLETYISGYIGSNTSRSESAFTPNSFREWFLRFNKNWDVDTLKNKLGNSVTLLYFEIFVTKIE